MAVKRYGGDITFICDECGCDESVEEGTFESQYTFQDAWSMMKEDGWRCHKEGERWVHNCTTCVQEWAMKRRAEQRRDEAKSTRDALSDIRDSVRRR